jgi:hypothetical protein
MKMIKRSGDGIGMSITKSGRAGVKVEPKANAGFPGGVNQMGAATAFRKEPILREGAGYTPKKMGPTGVGNATVRPDTPGPGSGRTTYAKGTQGTYGPVNPVNRTEHQTHLRPSLEETYFQITATRSPVQADVSEAGMDEPIEKNLLDGIKSLDNEDLTKLIISVNEVGWPKSIDYLKLLLAERGKGGG